MNKVTKCIVLFFEFHTFCFIQQGSMITQDSENETQGLWIEMRNVGILFSKNGFYFSPSANFPFNPDGAIVFENESGTDL